MSININDALAVVVSQDGVHFVACATAQDMVDAVDRAMAAGDNPVVFTRKPAGKSVTNIAPRQIGGNFVQARDIYGGVTM